MPFSAAARSPCFTNRLTSPRAGPPTSPAPPTETTDANRHDCRLTFCSPLVARPSRMVRRRRLRKLSSFETHPVRHLPHPHARRVLCRTAQSPLFAPQPLLLTSRKNAACCRQATGVDSPQLRLGPSQHSF